jgi:VanZ family protein
MGMPAVNASQARAAQGSDLVPAATSRSRGAVRWFAMLCVLLVTHGSLYPWQFQWPASFGEAWMQMMHQASWWTGLGDVVGNVVLFVPVGALGWLLLEGARARPALRLGLLFVGGVAFAFALQVAQIFVPARDAALSDMVWNTLGLALGLPLPALARRAGLRSGAGLAHQAPLWLALLWLALEWWPFVPTIDWQHIKDALKPLLLAPSWSTWRTLEVALSLVVLAHGLRGLPRRGANLLVLVALAGLGKLFIHGQALSLSHAVGWLLGLVGAGLAWRVAERRATLCLLWASLLWFTLDELRPFTLADTPSVFQWLPFVAALQGSLISNTAALIWNLFWLGAVMLFAQHLGARMGITAVALGLWTLLLEGLQTWLPGRIADITPALLPLLWLLLLRGAEPAMGRNGQRNPPRWVP